MFLIVHLFKRIQVSELILFTEPPAAQIVIDTLTFSSDSLSLEQVNTPWFLYKMVAHFTIRTYGVKQGFRFVEVICLHRKSNQSQFFFRKRPILYHMCV